MTVIHLAVFTSGKKDRNWQDGTGVEK